MNRSLLIFQNSLKSKETIESYTYYLDKFVEFVSEEMKLPVDYDSLSSIAHDKIQIMIEDYIMILKKRVNPNSIPTFYYPIQSFCEANDIFRNLYQRFGKKAVVIQLGIEGAFVILFPSIATIRQPGQPFEIDIMGSAILTGIIGVLHVFAWKNNIK